MGMFKGDEDLASDFLYWHPLGGGFPHSDISIRVEFEVGGAYEDWGFVIERKLGDTKQILSAGRTLKEAIDKARAQYPAPPKVSNVGDSL